MEGPATNPIGTPAPPPPGYPHPPYQNYPPYPPQAYPGYVQGAKTNGMAIASMVLGIVWIYWLGSILALVFGYIAKRQIAESNGTQRGSGMATAGIVLGWVGVGTLVLAILVFVIAAATDDPYALAPLG